MKPALFQFLPPRERPDSVPELAILLRDVGHDRGHLSITNDANRVVRSVMRTAGVRRSERIFYYDSEGNIDELVHDGERFVDFAPGPTRLGSPMQRAIVTLRSMSARAVVRLKIQGTARVLNGVPGMTFPVDRAHLNVRHDVVIVHVRDYRYVNGMAAGYQTWTMHLGDDCELVEFETAKGVRI